MENIDPEELKGRVSLWRWSRTGEASQVLASRVSIHESPVQHSGLSNPNQSSSPFPSRRQEDRGASSDASCYGQRVYFFFPQTTYE
ncbi:hypothetical protein E2C01_084808 [Portunus trituberculatus]|uniref:Uncharacterized protein n=1 Tax=Portunus trituberculatus TaxID=210409 RepID=A0A5B7J8R2_PORTR|nr:hypothetical protein [Portunus trituberculatus]